MKHGVAIFSFIFLSHFFINFKKLSAYLAQNFLNFIKLVWFWAIFEGFMDSRVQKIMFWDTLKNAKSVILHYFPVAEIGRNTHLLYFSYPQEIYSQFVEWEKNVWSPSSPQWSVHISVSLLLITRKHPVYGKPHIIDIYHLLSEYKRIKYIDTKQSV